MSQRTIPTQAIFVEREGWVYYVANWQRRFNDGGRARLVRLSPRHFVRYNELKEKGRSQKTIALLLFKRVPTRPAAASASPREASRGGDTRTVSVDIGLLTHQQLLTLLQRDLDESLARLRA